MSNPNRPESATCPHASEELEHDNGAHKKMCLRCGRVVHLAFDAGCEGCRMRPTAGQVPSPTLGMPRST